MIEVRQASGADWDAIGALANASVRHVPGAGPQAEWLSNRIGFSGQRWHFVAERSGAIAGYGSLEAQTREADSSFRQFLVVPWDTDAGAEVADVLLMRLVDVARSEQVANVWMREYADDGPMLDHLLARGFALGRRYIWNGIALAELNRRDPQHDDRIMRASQVSNEVWRALGVTSGDVFELASMNTQWRAKNDHFIFYRDDEPLAHVGILDGIAIVAGDVSLTVAGIGGVITQQDHRRKGLARGLLGYVTRILSRENRSDFAMLFCHDLLVPYYSKLGWSLLSDSVEVRQGDGYIKSPLNTMVLPLRGLLWPGGPVVVHELPF
jgi:GNAT superfamily N-acetyltransferase